MCGSMVTRSAWRASHCVCASLGIGRSIDEASPLEQAMGVAGLKLETGPIIGPVNSYLGRSGSFLSDPFLSSGHHHLICTAQVVHNRRVCAVCARFAKPMVRIAEDGV